MPFSFEQSQDEIARLVKHFLANRATYRAPAYKEAHARQEFIDPLFVALNWDVANRQQAAPEVREVIVEDSLSMEGQAARKAPDYAFRVGRERKFFAEAKKPGVDLKKDAAPAYQLRRYAWSAKLPLSLLTDFEELAVYDCRIRPAEKDKPSVARLLYLTCEEYVDRWQEIWDLFSREAVWGGQFDVFTHSGKGKRGASEVDAEFLKEIEGWRDSLAKNIALRNPRLTIDELNDSVQRLIDRLIFLRMAEDRGIEDYGQLQRLAEGEGLYAELLTLSRRADAKYNSGLFDFSKAGDTVTPRLTVDDKALRPILADLYYPQSPYEFSVLPVEILGNVYEQFLGKVIKLTEGHRAKVEEKPEVKKAGGVYYTPAYIVEYIVKHTVGVAVAGKTPQQLKGFRTLDPACGSGSFLLGAYSFLLDYYQQWYTAHEPEKHKPAVMQVNGGWQLTLAERKRILTEHIFGVDIDRQAVEVTKLSLLLKVLEGVKQLTLFAERALPNLDANIKAGNSLIGPDYFAGQLLPDRDELRRVNPFDWAAEFPEVMKAGGFDCVIGNPPYGAELSSDQKTYVQKLFLGESKSLDTYELFLLQSKRVLQRDGRISMIIPASWLTGEKYEASRRKLVHELYPVIAYALPFDVFKDAYIDTAIVVLTSSVSETCLVHFFPKKERLTVVPENLGSKVPVANIRQDSLSRLSVLLSVQTAPVLKKVNSPKVQFSEWFDISRGVQPYSRSKHTEQQIQSRFLHATSRKSKQYMPELQGSELSRYQIGAERTSFLKYSVDIASTRPLRMFEGKRIALRRLLTRKFRLQACLAVETMITTDNVLNMIPKIEGATVEFALGILNSKLISWVYVNSSMIAQKDDFPQVHISALSAIRLPNFDKARHDNMVALVEQMLELHKRQAQAKDAAEQGRLQRLIDSTDKQIDALVYELYGLSAEEIAVISTG